MKMPPEVFEQLKASIAPMRADILANAKRLGPTAPYQPGGKGNLPMRVRWDAFNVADGEVRAACYFKHGLNDNHIDSALKRIMREMDLPQFAA